MRTAAIVPVKQYAKAKRRLAARLGQRERTALVDAMFKDVLAALEQVPRLDAIVVVTSNRAIADEARAAMAVVVEDHGAGCTAAARSGIRHAIAARFERVLIVPGDTPLIDPLEIDALLARAEAADAAVVIVPDRHGSGTNGLLLRPPDVIPPAFGVASCDRHRMLAAAVGASTRIERLPSLALDVDTPADLDALLVSRPTSTRPHGLSPPAHRRCDWQRWPLTTRP